MQQQLAHYQIQNLLGQGTFASVYRAFDQKFEREVALKILKPVWLSDPEAVGRFKREAKTMAQLRHPHIVDVYDVGEAEGCIYLAQLLVDGETLTDRLKRGPLKWTEMLEVLRSMASALDYAHGQGIVHRDVKPSNIMVAQDGRAYLGDFGLVRAAEGSVVLSTSSGGMIGTPAYMAPEQWEGKEATAVTDVYALSCVVVEMLTGRVLFDGTTPATVMRQHLLEGPKLPDTWPADIPEQVSRVLRQGLAENPTERISRAGELFKALEALSTLPAVEEAEKVPPLWLISSTGQRYKLKPGSLTLGRSATCDIHFDDRLASRHHATLKFDGQRCIVYDENSANGTFINGKPVQTGGQPFEVGDRLKIGNTQFALRTAVPATPGAVKKKPKSAVKPSPPAPKRRSLSGLMVALIGSGGLLALIACAVLAYFLWGPIGDGTPDKAATAQAIATAQAAATQTAIAQKDDDTAATAQAETVTAQAVAAAQAAATQTAIAQEGADAAATAQAETATAQAIATEQKAATETLIAQKVATDAAATAQAETATAQAIATVQAAATQTAIAQETADAAATAQAATATAYAIDNPPIEVSPDKTIDEGECTDLSWKIQHVNAVYLNNNPEPVNNEGSQQVCPTTTTIYRLRIVKLNGNQVEREVTITVIPKPPTPDLLTTHSPALATFKNKLFLAFRTSDNGVWLANYDGTEWEVHGAISGVYSNQGPALAVFNNRLYLATRGHNNELVWVTSSTNGSSWADDYAIPGVNTSHSPALAVFNNRLYLATKGHNNESVWVTSSTNGSTWPDDYAVSGVYTLLSPALAVFNNRLYLATRGHNNELVWVTSSTNGSSWADDYAVSGVKTSHSPALAVFNNRLYLATKGHNNELVWVTSSTNGSSWPDDYAVSGVKTSHNPALAVFNGRLYLAFKGHNNEFIWLTSTADGSKWTGLGQIP